MNYKKIAIIGISASGKSTFSRELGAKTGLPLFHMDNLFWKGNWQEVPESEYLRAHEILIQKDKWIIEGYVDPKMSSRLQSADLILYLDYSGIRCAWQVILRWLKHRKESRPELPTEALERFKLRTIWKVFTRKEREVIEEAIEISNPKQLKRFYSQKELARFISSSPLQL